MADKPTLTCSARGVNLVKFFLQENCTMSDSTLHQDEHPQSTEEPEVASEAQELSDEDLEHVAGGWTGDDGGNGGG